MSNTLLVIDDSPTVRKLVELSFANKPWQLFFAASGREGMTLSERVRPEVVLLDYVLPDMNGTDVCAELVRRGLDGLRVVLMTAKEERIRTQFASYPMVVDYVTKPFTAELVVGKATSALQKPRGGAPRSTGSTLGAQGDDQRHALGQALYAVLRGKLNDAPQWLRESPGTAPGPMLARRLLTDETLASVAAELGPLSRYAPIAAPPAKQPLPSEGVLNALDIIEVLSRKRKTGSSPSRATPRGTVGDASCKAVGFCSSRIAIRVPTCGSPTRLDSACRSRRTSPPKRRSRTPHWKRPFSSPSARRRSRCRTCSPPSRPPRSWTSSEKPRHEPHGRKVRRSALSPCPHCRESRSPNFD